MTNQHNIVAGIYDDREMFRDNSLMNQAPFGLIGMNVYKTEDCDYNAFDYLLDT